MTDRGGAPPPPDAWPPPPSEGPAEDEAGWAAPPRPAGADPPPTGAFAPPPAPFPTGDAAAASSRSQMTPRGGHRRRRAAGVGSLAAVAVVAVRFFLGGADDPSSSTTFTPPPRAEGRPVAATPLTSEAVCELLTPAELRAVYGRGFEQGRPLDTGSSPATGEPSDVPDVGAAGGCTWTTRPGEETLLVTLLAVPSIGGDANRTYELLRPSSPTQGFDTSTPVGDEAFVRFNGSSAQEGYADSMVVRSGGVVLNVDVRGDAKPEGGLDLVVEVAQAAVADLPTDP